MKIKLKNEKNYQDQKNIKFVKRFIVAIDQGTTSSRAILFSLSGKPVCSSQKEFKQYFPKDGWVEHDPNEIWNTTKKVLINIIKKSKNGERSS